MTTFDEEFLKALAARGVVVGADGKWAVDPEYTGTPVSVESLRYFNESAARGQDDLNAQLRLRWVLNLAEVTDVLVRQGTNAPWPYYPVFWIRLYGVFNDVAAPYERAFQTLGIDRHTHKANGGSLLHIAQFVLGANDMIRERLTEDEWVYADYKRHSESHPIQSSFDLRLQKGKVVEKHGIPALGKKEFTVAHRWTRSSSESSSPTATKWRSPSRSRRKSSRHSSR